MKKEKRFLHDDGGRYLALLEENHMDIYPEVRRQFFERNSMKVENMQGFILKQTGCQGKSLLRFIIQMQQYCLALAELAKVVIEVDQASKLKVDDGGDE